MQFLAINRFNQTAGPWGGFTGQGAKKLFSDSLGLKLEAKFKGHNT